MKGDKERTNRKYINRHSQTPNTTHAKLCEGAHTQTQTKSPVCLLLLCCHPIEPFRTRTVNYGLATLLLCICVRVCVSVCVCVRVIHKSVCRQIFNCSTCKVCLNVYLMVSKLGDTTSVPDLRGDHFFFYLRYFLEFQEHSILYIILLNVSGGRRYFTEVHIIPQFRITLL